METPDEKVEDIHAEMERCVKSLGRRNKYIPRLGTYEFMHLGDRFKSAHQREMKERDERIDRALRVLREAVGGIKPPVDGDSSEVYQDARYENGKFVGKPLPHSVCADWYNAIVKAQSILSGDEAKETPPPPKEEHPAPPAKEAEPQKCHPCVAWHGIHCFDANVQYGERGERIGQYLPYICPCDARCKYYKPDTNRPKIWETKNRTTESERK